jgi:tetratricopeptide (TPR) repeat protein
MCQDLLEEGTVLVKDGQAALTRSLDRLTLPTTVQAVIRSRLDRLDENHREVLRLASVIGREFGQRLLERAYAGERSLTPLLEALKGQELIQQMRVLPEVAYQFKHVLTQVVVYETLLIERRKELHEVVGKALETLYADKKEEIFALLAHHFSRAQRDEEASVYNLKAGIRARGDFANHPEKWRELAMQAQENLGDILGITGRHEEARARFAIALTHLPEGERFISSRICRKTANTWVIEREYEEAVLAFGKAENSLGEDPPEADFEWWKEWIAIKLDQLMMYYWQAQTEKMAELLEQTRPFIDQYGTLGQRAEFFQRLSWMAFRRDNYVISEETLTDARTAAAASIESENPILIGVNQFGVGFCHLWRGELDEATRHLNEALSLSKRIGDVTLQARCLTYLTIAYRKREQLEETRDFISKSLGVANEGHMLEYIGTAKANLAWVAWREGNFSETEENGLAALELWKQLSIVYAFQWTALWPLIGVSIRQGKMKESIAYGRSLLDPFQQRLPGGLSESVGESIKAWDRGDHQNAKFLLEQSMEPARRMGCL